MDINKIINRAKNLIVNPNEEWEAIRAENEENSQVLTNYVLPLIVAVALASFLGDLLFGFNVSFIGTILKIILKFGLALLYIYIFAYIMQILAPSFGGNKENPNFVKLSAYMSTPSYLISIITGFFPMLIFLGILNLYSIYLLWTGADKLLDIPETQKTGFVVISILLMIVVYMILYSLFFSLIFASIIGTTASVFL